MTKQELIEALKSKLEPGEEVTVKREKLESLGGLDLFNIWRDVPSHIGAIGALRAVVMADRKREVERLAETFGIDGEITVSFLGYFIGVDL